MLQFPVGWRAGAIAVTLDIVAAPVRNPKSARNGAHLPRTRTPGGCECFATSDDCASRPRRRVPDRRARARRVSGAADHADRAVGRGRRHRRHRAPDRHDARARLEAAGQRREPHRRPGRGRPFGDRDRRARRLHDRAHHARDQHDALGGSDRPHLRGLHAARADQSGPRRDPREDRLAVQEPRRTCSPTSRRTRTRWSPRARGRAEAGTSRSPA